MVLRPGVSRMNLLKQSRAWQSTRGINDKKARGATCNSLLKECGLTPALMITYARKRKNEATWHDRLGSNVAQRIAEHAFSVVPQHVFGKRGRPRVKGAQRPLHSLEATTNKANILWKRDIGCVTIGTLMLPAMLPSEEQDPYLIEGLHHRTKYCRVLWRNVQGSRRWFVPLMQEGIQPNHHHRTKDAVVGLDVGPSTLAVVGEHSASLVTCCETVIQPWKETPRLQRAMDRSERVTNPYYFNENGTWKRGQRFTPSKRYPKIRIEYAEVEHKLAAERKRSHGELANQIIDLGNSIQTEKLSYISFHKNHGKSIKARSSGMFIEQLRRKAESAGGEWVE